MYIINFALSIYIPRLGGGRRNKYKTAVIQSAHIHA